MDTKLFRNTKTGQTKLIPERIYTNQFRMKGNLWQPVEDGSVVTPVVPVHPKPTPVDPTASMSAEQKELYERVTGTAPEIESVKPAPAPITEPPAPKPPVTTKPKTTNKK